VKGQRDYQSEELARRIPAEMGFKMAWMASRDRVPDRQPPHCSLHTEGH